MIQCGMRRHNPKLAAKKLFSGLMNGLTVHCSEPDRIVLSDGSGYVGSAEEMLVVHSAVKKHLGLMEAQERWKNASPEEKEKIKATNAEEKKARLESAKARR